MSTYSFGDVAYSVKSEIERITDKYTEYLDIFAERLERDNSTLGRKDVESYMLKEKRKFFVILKRHVELLPNVISRCVSTIDLGEIGTLYRMESSNNTSWIYASKLETREKYQSDDLIQEIVSKIEKENVALTENEDIIEEIKKASEKKQEEALEQKRLAYENQKEEREFLESRIKTEKEKFKLRKDEL